MKVQDWTQRCDIGRPAPVRSRLPAYVIVHGHGAKSGLWPIRDAGEMAQFHSHHPDLNGRNGPLLTGRAPYGFVITLAGDVQQAVRLSLFGCHSMDFNPVSIGIAVLYRDRLQRPPDPQLRALYWLCNLLSGEFGAEILGHSEAHQMGGLLKPPLRATGSKTKKLGDPDQCPPAALPMDEIRRHAYQGECMSGGALQAAGVVM